MNASNRMSQNKKPPSVPPVRQDLTSGASGSSLANTLTVNGVHSPSGTLSPKKDEKTMIKFLTVERNYDSLKNIARKGETLAVHLRL